MSRSGLRRIDGLFEGTPGTKAVGPGDTDKESVGAIQDLLRGHGLSCMPSPADSDYGMFGNHTKTAVRAFRAQKGLDPSGVVDSLMMRTLIQTPAAKPLASRPYVTLALDCEWNDLTKILLLTARLEGQGEFGAINANQDKAGLSYGIIQWAQSPGRLHEILRAFSAEDMAAFTTVFGGGDPTVASGLLKHTARPHGGVDTAGRTTDRRFDLTEAAWRTRFQAAALSRPFQKVQVATALAAFESAFKNLRSYAPEFTAERQVAFMLDLANQFGPGGARSLYHSTARNGQPPGDHLAAIADQSVHRMAAALKKGTRNRRDLFLHTPLLSDAQQPCLAC